MSSSTGAASGGNHEHALPPSTTSTSIPVTESPTGSSLFLVTAPDHSVTTTIAESILTKKLAACVNVIPKVTSMYWWEGKIQKDSEELLIIKSRNELAGELEKEVKALHPYDVAEFISIPITSGSLDYLDWIKQTTAGGRPSS